MSVFVGLMIAQLEAEVAQLRTENAQLKADLKSFVQPTIEVLKKIAGTYPGLCSVPTCTQCLAKKELTRLTQAVGGGEMNKGE